MRLRLPIRLFLSLLTATALGLPALSAQHAAPQQPHDLGASVETAHLITAPTPEIRGTARPGARLHVMTKRWHPASVALHVRWLRNGRPIAGATHRRYTVRAADRGSRLVVVVRGTRSGSPAVERRSTAILIPPPARRTASTSPSPTRTPGTASTPRPSLPAVRPASPSPMPTAGPASPSTAPAPSASATSEVGIGIPGDGDLAVGATLRPGAYVTAAPTTGCTWKIVSAFGGPPSSTLRSGAGFAQQILQVNAGDFGVSTKGCGAWVPAAAAPGVSTIGSGVYVVGPQMAPGTYRASVPADGCYWSTLSGFDGATSSVMEEHYVTGRSTVDVTVPESAAGFRSSSCGTWTRVG